MQIILAKPRGFCAGVERAIDSVERALALYGAPIYVLNDIVHNAAVVRGLADRGVVFVRRLADVPAGSLLLFSAHGVPPERWEEARALNLRVVDATCPLVEKVHKEAQRFAEKGYTVVLVGEAGHDEVVATAGWAAGYAQVLFSEEEVAALNPPDPDRIAYVTQTTLSVTDYERIVNALRSRFPKIEGPRAGDICYATQNRQQAIHILAAEADLMLVVGDQASANSRRLAEICKSKGKPGYLISSAAQIDPAWLEDVSTILITSGASVPESLVQEVVQVLTDQYACCVEEREVALENVHFVLPEPLRNH